MLDSLVRTLHRTRSGEVGCLVAGEWVTDGPARRPRRPWMRGVVSTARQAGRGRRRATRCAYARRGAKSGRPDVAGGPGRRARTRRRGGPGAARRAGPPAGAGARQAGQGRPGRDRPGGRHLRRLRRRGAPHRRRGAAGRRLGPRRRQHRADPPGPGRRRAGDHAVQRAGQPARAQARRRRSRPATPPSSSRRHRRRRRRPPWWRCCSSAGCRPRRSRCCTATAGSVRRCAPRRRSASSASPAARPTGRRGGPRGRRQAARPGAGRQRRHDRVRGRRHRRAPPGSAPRTGYSNSGQSCISVQRVYVQRARYDEFVDALHRARWRS